MPRFNGTPVEDAKPRFTGMPIEEDGGFNPVDLANKGVNLGLKYQQGRTFGVIPKALSGMGAVMAKPVLEATEAAGITGETPSIPELYGKIYGDFRGKLEQADRETPLLSAGAEILGSAKTGIQAGNTKAGQAVSGWIGGSKLPQGASLAARAAKLLERAGKSAIIGEAGYRAYKTGTARPGEEGMEAVSGFPVGGAVGLAAPILSAGISKAIPVADDGLKEVAKIAKKYNIPVSVSQITNSKPIKNIQKVSQELPFSGHDKFREKQLTAFNRAITKTFGAESDRITPEVMNKAFTQVGKEFDDLGRGKIFQVAPLKSSIDEILADSSAYTDDAVGAFNKEVETVLKNVDETGNISGEKLSFLRSRLNKLARKTSDFDKKTLFHDLENSVIDLMTEGDDAAKGALSAAKQKYKNLLAIEPLAQKAKGGNISPSLLNNRVAKIFGRQFTRGQAGELGDLARIGNELLPELGGSDTLQKSAVLLGTGAALTNPKTIIPAAGGLATNKAYQSWFNQNQGLIQKMVEDEFAKQMLSGPTAGLLGTTAAAIE